MTAPQFSSPLRRFMVLIVVSLMLAGLQSEVPQDASRLPGVSGADNELQRGAANIIWMLEGIELARAATDDESCELTERRIVNTEVLKLPKRPGRSPWKEKWTVDRCGELVFYSIKFTPTPKQGGTDINVSVMDDGK